jgi:hypothetical protein
MDVIASDNPRGPAALAIAMRDERLPAIDDAALMKQQFPRRHARRATTSPACQPGARPPVGG